MSENTLEYISLEKLFPEIQKENDLKMLLDSSKVISIRVFKKSRGLDITLDFNRIISCTDVERLEKLIKKNCGLNRTKIWIQYKSFKKRPSYLKDYYDNIMYYLKSELPICAEILLESECEHEGNILLIKLRENGTSILNQYKCGKRIEELIKDKFNDSISVEFKEKEGQVKYKENEIIARYIKETKVEQKQNSDNNTNKTNERQEVVLGKKITKASTPINDVTPEIGNIVVEGDIFSIDNRKLKNNRYIISFDITDYTSSITIKFFCANENKYKEISRHLHEGIFVRVKGELRYDKYAGEYIVFASDIMKSIKKKKMDTAKEKRVELHLHTKMSSMDGVTSATDIVKRAADWGHKAVAITDHGVVQAFPEAYETGKKNNIKIIYGMECYLINDSTPVVYNAIDMPIEGEFVVFDLETTGLNAQKDRITEIGAVKVQNGVVIDTFSSFVNPCAPIPFRITELTGITDEMVKGAPKISEVLKRFLKFSEGCVLVAHNSQFDNGFIKVNASREGLEYESCILDTLELCRLLFPKQKKHGLGNMVKHLNIQLRNHHRALDDAQATASILIKCFELLKEKDIININMINSSLSKQKNIKTMPSYHAVILVKDQIGLKNLYKLISSSHLEYFYKKPRIPRSLFLNHRQGLMIGSACEAGELYTAILDGKPYDELSKIVKFYDYLEIQPLGNNRFLLENERVKSTEQLMGINREIIKLGEQHNKLVVATCDVHFLDPHDEVFRRILMAGQKYSDADNQAPLYFRTTDEMLAEFEYLGEEKAYEVVVKNTNLIADEIEDIRPIPEETFSPEIEGAEEELKKITIEVTKKRYGEDIPDIVAARLEKELNSIIKNGFSVMYIIAQKLVWKSLSDGYLVGSRGSVGSSFVANMSGITEVNSLPPHYICPECKYSEFITDGSVGAGVDMEDKDCPKCGVSLDKDGFDIPFETFLGFDGDKEPDIDLNFSGEYQPMAHKYTEELFGEKHVFRAGTISTIAEKTAFGFVKKYMEARERVISNAELNRLVKGCSGIKKTTGQHPGGVMIVPKKNDIHEFCPIQRPADDTDSNIITTHFDYHAISGKLLKLDILGHDDPTMIRMLEDLTGVNARIIPLDDPDTMSIFTSTQALGIEAKEINSQVGTFAVPEFGTKFVRQMLIDTKPTTFSELVRISGLSHGTDVWLNNAQELVRDGTASLSEVICTRDDIMVYLMHKGLEAKHAFKIMESVRKGKGLTPEDEKTMKAFNVPGWYIESCKRIKYMFPKAHAVAYVTMAFRIAYFKVHYPEAFYITYFTVRADDFDAELMANGVEKVRNKIKEIERKGNEATAKEKNILTVLEVCNEMYSRGFKLIPVDLYKSDPIKFLHTDQGILPPLISLQGLGKSAAQNIANVRDDGKFLSIDDLRLRAKSSKTVIEILQKNGCFKDLPESNQLSLF